MAFGRKRRLQALRNASIAEAWSRSQSLQEMADELNLSTETVARCLSDMGLRHRRPRAGRSSRTAHRRRGRIATGTNSVMTKSANEPGS